MTVEPDDVEPVDELAIDAARDYCETCGRFTDGLTCSACGDDGWAIKPEMTFRYSPAELNARYLRGFHFREFVLAAGRAARAKALGQRVAR